MRKMYKFIKIQLFSLFLFFSFGTVSMAAPTNPFDRLGGVGSIADDVRAFLQYLIWIAGPIWFLWHLFKYKKAEDPGERKEARHGMITVMVVIVASQLVVWLLYTYLAPKFR